jgi:hypothetical protein
LLGNAVCPPLIQAIGAHLISGRVECIVVLCVPRVECIVYAQTLSRHTPYTPYTVHCTLYHTLFTIRTIHTIHTAYS